MLPAEQYRLLVEAAPTLVWRSGLDAKCDYFNATWLAFTGRTLEQELGDGWVEGVHADDLQRCVDVYLSSFEQRRPFEMEYRLRRYDGVHRWILDRGVPFQVAGRFGGFIGSCMDVHERREADRAKTTFLSMLAHELRTPLQTLTLCNEEVERRVPTGEPIPPSIVQRIRRQIDRLQALVDRASRGIEISRGMTKELRLAEVDLVELVTEVVAEHPVRGSKAEVRFRGATGTPRAVRVDAIHIAQVLDVLLDNAVKYSPHGGTVAVSLAFEPAVVRLVIEDEGIGIPEADLSRVGAPYYRGSNVASKEYAGMGLGLAVAHDIVGAHGGRMRHVARVPTGTRVTVELPLPPTGAGPSSAC